MMHRNDERAALFEDKIGYTFKNREFLMTALTHSSYANEYRVGRIVHNERMEFLGDAVLELVCSDFLYREHPDMSEGKLSRRRASLVCEPALALCARDIGLGEFLYMGKGEERSGGRDRDSILSDAIEAVIGAVYMDGGIEKASGFIMRYILNDIDHKGILKDSKTLLQELIQKDHLGTIKYELADTLGPEQDRFFLMNVLLDDQVIGSGKGRSKQAASQEAACEALNVWGRDRLNRD